MFKLNTILKILPQIATHPLALVILLCVVAIWVLVLMRGKKSDDFLKALGSLPKEERSAFARNSGYKYDELASLPQKQRLKLLNSRYKLIAYIVTLVAFLLFGCMYFYAYEHDISEINKEYNNLKLKYEQNEKVQTDFRIKIESIQSSSDTAGRLTDDTELKRVGHELRLATDEFDKRFHNDMDSEMAFGVRVFRASAANSEGNYTEAQKLVTDEDLTAQSNLYGDMLLVRADAALGLGHLASAISFYKKLLALYPDSVRGLMGIADSERHMGKYKESIDMYNSMILVSESRKTPFWNAVTSKILNDQGLAYQELRNFDSAFNNYSEGIKLAESTTNDDEYHIHDQEWLLYVNRANLYSEFGQNKNASMDYKLALEKLNAIHLDNPESKNLSESIIYNGLCVNDMALENWENASTNINLTVNKLEPLVAADDNYLSEQLAAAYLNQGIVERNLGNDSLAFKSFNKSIHILDSLTNTESITPTVSLAKVYFNRASGYVDDNQYSNAIADYTMSAKMLLDVSKDGHPELGEFYANILTHRGICQFHNNHILPAIDDYDNAIEIYKIYAKKQRWDIASMFAGVLCNRGLAYEANDEFTNALDDFNQSEAVWNDFCIHGHPEYTNELPTLLVDRAELLLKLNQADKALRDTKLAVSILSSRVRYKSDTSKLLRSAFTVEARYYDVTGDLTNAIDEYEKSLKVFASDAKGLPEPDDGIDAESLFRCGNDYKILGNLSASIDCFNRSVLTLHNSKIDKEAIKEGLSSAFRMRGLTYLAEGKITNSISDFKECLSNIDEEPKRADCFNYLGILYWINDEKANATNCFNEEVKLVASERATSLAKLCLKQMASDTNSVETRKQLLDMLVKTAR